MFRPIANIKKFSSQSMVIVLYRFGMGMSRWWDLSICDVCYMLLFRGTGGGMMCAFLGCTAQVCSYYHPLLNTILDIVVLLTDTYTYCLYTQNGVVSFYKKDDCT